MRFFHWLALTALCALSSAHAFASFDACSEMRVGETRTIDRSVLPENFSLAVFPRYLLIHDAPSETGAENFEAAVAIDFIPDPQESPAVVPEMRAKAQLCYDALPAIEGPNHARLKIRLTRENERAPSNRVSVTSQSLSRENNRHWSTQSDCRVILHETLHLLGLVDLYTEKESLDTVPHQFDCRKTGPDETIMSDYKLAYLSDEYRIHACKCLDLSPKCVHAIRSLHGIQNACPANTFAFDYRAGLSVYERLTSVEKEALFHDSIEPLLTPTTSEDGTDYRYAKQEKAAFPTLSAAEFRMITAPGCVLQNQLYYQCAANSQRSTLDAPTAENPAGGCLPAPAICYHPGEWLR